MKSSITLTLVAMGSSLGSLQVGWADLVSYTFTTIDAPGATSTTAYGINNAGQIVGIGNGGFLDTHGVFTPLPNIPGITNSSPAALGINDAGQIVASVDVLSYLYTNGAFTPILIPGSETIANGINNADQVVGYYDFPFGASQGFVETNGVFTTIDVPGAAATFATGISNNGQIVGTFNDSMGSHGFLYSNGTFTSIDAPGATLTLATGVNRSGQIIGEFIDSSGHSHGFLDNAGIFTTFDVSGAQFINPFGINDAGQIVGNFGDNIGEHGFVATPITIPEPTALLLLTSGLACIVILIGRKRMTRTFNLPNHSHRPCPKI
jgi:probable HAF family extracellular repeat protein